ncbi:MAG TPA: hypothetical protein VJS44_05655 [Pyrinomonadaceae bacterium]|nr:hypothetical protein [Pyrinomonadaceae bacterium]
MAEAKKDDVGTTGDGLGEGRGAEASGGNEAGGVSADDKATASSKGTIGTGSEDADLSQASGGSVD